MTAGHPDPSATVGHGFPFPPRRQIAFSIGNWRVTYTGTDPHSPRTGDLAGPPEVDPGGARVPVIAVTAPPAGEPPAPRCPPTGESRHP
ncbi:hypothetical protein BJY18_005666 [Amycolatopsis jiangsuensis]|uniref:Uncharacterized protein n=1 Tax=Amycolatopsis jiangsuensis TaxID=1181879 RepID=A0A840IZA0_9PSEU|nr:hypothetical protein [Amycolatopsis jiangsuensis]